MLDTAFHAWMAKNVHDYYRAHDLDPPYIEHRIDAGNGLTGTTDLFTVYWGNSVVDWKLCGKDTMSAVAEEFPSKHRIQANIYGVGIMNEQIGTVDNIAVVYLPRSGRLKDAVVHAEEFNPELAYEFMERRWRIEINIKEIWKIDQNPHLWPQVPATPGKDCFFCPYRNDKLEAAGPTGCPGR